MLPDEDVRALVRARAERWVERKLRNRNRYVRRMRRIDPRWGWKRQAYRVMETAADRAAQSWKFLARPVGLG